MVPHQRAHLAGRSCQPCLALARLRWRVRRETHHQHRARGEPDHAFRDTPSQDMAQPGPPMRAHNDHVNVGRVSRVDDDLERHAMPDGGVTREPGCRHACVIG